MRKVKRIFMVGIGGIGMCGIAELLLNQGFKVAGSDLKLGETTSRLASLGAEISEGHRAANVQGAEVVVCSSAVGPDNPEASEARRLGIPVVRRAEMLAELMRLKTGIAVAGSHGKTTTTSLIAAALDEGGLDPTYVIGGRLKSTASGARLGAGEYLLAEADESDGSFLSLSPIYAVATNLDREHMEHYGTMEALRERFAEFLNKVPFFGRVIVNRDDIDLSRMLDSIVRPKTTYGFSDSADYQAIGVRREGLKMRYELIRRGESVGEVRLGLLGRHNVSNSLAAVAIADELGVPLEATSRALEHFTGVGRRFEVHYRDDRYSIIDDYAHHPTEIRACLTTAREAHDGRLVAVFQPHRYSRTYDLMSDFKTAFDACDLLIVLDLYPAGEEPRLEADSDALAEAIQTSGACEVEHWSDSRPLRRPEVLESVLERMAQRVSPGDCWITMGAGDVTQIAPALARRIKSKEKA